MKEIHTITKLFYLITLVDGEQNEKEIEIGKKLAFHEKVNEIIFFKDLNTLNSFSHEDIYAECVQELKKAKEETQIRYLAWIGLIANADGFMDKKEWQILYDLYHKELKISLHDILNKQRDLANLIQGPLKTK